MNKFKLPDNIEKIIILSIPIMIVLYGYLSGFQIIGGYPIHMTHAGTIQYEISNWIWDDIPWETSFLEIIKSLCFIGSIVLLSLSLSYIVFKIIKINRRLSNKNAKRETLCKGKK